MKTFIAALVIAVAFGCATSAWSCEGSGCNGKQDSGGAKMSPTPWSDSFKKSIWPHARLACTEMGGQCNSIADCCPGMSGCAWVTGCSMGTKCCY